MTLVIDASAILGWRLQEDGAAIAAIRRALAGPMLVPSLWTTEVAHGLIKAHRHGRITVAEQDQIAEAVAALRIEVVPSPDIVTITRLAARAGLSAYDAEYLHLAIDRSAVLLTLDPQLALSASRVGVPLAPGSIAP